MFEDIPTTAPRRYGKLVSTISISARRYKKFNEIRREKKVSRIKTKTNIKIHTTIYFNMMGLLYYCLVIDWKNEMRIRIRINEVNSIG